VVSASHLISGCSGRVTLALPIVSFYFPNPAQPATLPRRQPSPATSLPWSSWNSDWCWTTVTIDTKFSYLYLLSVTIGKNCYESKVLQLCIYLLTKADIYISCRTAKLIIILTRIARGLISGMLILRCALWKLALTLVIQTGCWVASFITGCKLLINQEDYLTSLTHASRI